MKYCQECGRMLRDADETCPYCGTYQDIYMTGSSGATAPQSFDVNDSYSYQEQPRMDSYQEQPRVTPEEIPQGTVIHGEYVRKYSFAAFVILSILTLGIYSVYIKYKWNKDVNNLCRGVGEDSVNYIVVWILSYLTCGIFGLYWVYKQTERLKETGYRNGVEIWDSGIQNLLLLLLTGLPGYLVVWYILFHNTNRLSAVYNGERTRESVNAHPSHKGLIVLAVVLAVVMTILLTIGVIAGTLYMADIDTSESNLEEEILEGFGIDPESMDPIEDEFDEFSDMSFLLEGRVDKGPSVDFGKYAIEIKDATKMYDFDGKKAVVIDLNWTNKSDEEASALWVFSILASQGEKELQTTWPNYNEKDVSMEEYLENIEPGESLDFQVMFEVENDTDPIKVYAIVFDGETKDMAVKEFKITDQEA